MDVWSLAPDGPSGILRYINRRLKSKIDYKYKYSIPVCRPYYITTSHSNLIPEASFLLENNME